MTDYSICRDCAQGVPWWDGLCPDCQRRVTCCSKDGAHHPNITLGNQLTGNWPNKIPGNRASNDQQGDTP